MQGGTMKKFSLSLTAVVYTWSFILIACSAQIAPINAGADGVALKGYDPVAYFTLGKPVKGQKEFQFEWKNAKWLSIVGGKLYLNLNKDVQNIWDKNRQGYIKKADKNWPQLIGK
jgi:hypothetical protein